MMQSLTDARKRKQLTQAELAEQLQVNQPTVSMWEAGKSLPSKDMRQEIQQFLQANIFFNHNAPLTDAEGAALGRMFKDVLDRTNETEAVRFFANQSRQQVRQLIRAHGYYQEPICYPTTNNGLKIPE